MQRLNVVLVDENAVFLKEWKKSKGFHNIDMALNDILDRTRKMVKKNGK